MNITWFTQVFIANGSWTAPDNLLIGSVGAFCTGPGGTGAGSIPLHDGGAAGGGGAFGGEPQYGGVGPGTVLTITVPAGGSGLATTITGGSVTVSANGGANGSGTGAGAAGGAAGTNTQAFAGGLGGSGTTAASGIRSGGGGGGSAGSTGAGGAGTNGGISASTGGAAGTGNPAGAVGGGCAVGGIGQPGNAPGAGGAGPAGGNTPGAGSVGQAVIVWAVITTPAYSRGTPSAVRGRSASSAGAIVQQFVPPAPSPFSPPRRAPRGLAPVRGRVLELGQYSAGAPIRPSPAGFTPPRRAPRGLAPVRGRTIGLGQYSPGSPVITVPAPFTPPRRAPRGRAPVRGRVLELGQYSAGAPVFVRKNLLMALAANNGTDDYGTPFFQGITVYSQVSNQFWANLNDAVLTFQTENAQTNQAQIAQFGEGGMSFSSGSKPGFDPQAGIVLFSTLRSGIGASVVALTGNVTQLNSAAAVNIPATAPSVSTTDGVAIVSFLRSVGICL